MKIKRKSPSWIVFTLVSLFLFYEMGVQVSPSVMTHQLMSALHTGAVGLGLMSGFYFYSYTGMQVPAGILLDRFGVRRVVATALLVCAIGASLFGMMDSVVTGSFARLFMGFGSAFAFVSVLSVANRWFPPRYFAFLAGMAQLFAAFGAMGGEYPMAYSVNVIGWRETMFILAIASVVLSALVAIFVTDPPEKPKPEPQFCDENISASGVLIKTISNPQTWFLALYAFLNWAPMAAFASLWGVPFIQKWYQLTGTEAASLVSWMWIGIAIGSPGIGYLSDLIGRRKLLLWLSPLCGLISSLCLIYVHFSSLWIVGILLFIMGASCSGQLLSFAVVRDIAPRGGVATAIAVNNMAEVASGAVLQPFVGYLISLSAGAVAITAATPQYTTNDYRFGMIVIPILYGVAFLLSAIAIRETFCKTEEDRRAQS